MPSFFATPEGKRFMIASLVLLDRVVFVLGVRVTPFDVGRAAPASHQALGVRPAIFVAEDDCISQARTRRMLPLPVEYQRHIAETSYRVVPQVKDRSAQERFLRFILPVERGRLERQHCGPFLQTACPRLVPKDL